METCKLRLGVIGTGIFSVKAHLPAIQQLKDKFEIVACANKAHERALEYAQLIDLQKDRVFADYKDVLALEDVEAVVIAVPVQHNYEMAKAALQKGKHVFLEKPIAHNLEDAKRVLALKDEYPDLVLMVAENYPHKESIQSAAQVISSGELGDIVTFSLLVSRQFDSSNVYLGTSWRQTPSHIGGFLSDGGVHWAALLTSILGPVESVAAFTRQIEKQNGAEDTMALTMKLKSGAIGNWTLTYAAGGAGFASLTVIGRQATMVFRDLNTLTVTNHKGETVKEQTFVDGPGPTVSAKPDIVDEFKDFYGTVERRRQHSHNQKEQQEGEADFVLLHKREPKVTLEETYHQLAIIHAALQSVESKAVETVPHTH